MSEVIVLDANKITKDFFHPEKISILKGISLQVKKGQSVAIVGASGSGKSTLLQILGTLESPTSGTISLYDTPIEKKNICEVRNKHIGFVFQAGNLLEEYTLLENLLLKAKIGRRSTKKGSKAYTEALEFLNQVDLSHRMHFPLKYLSGGEKQRGAIARALMNDPELILADEPTGNLDQLSSDHVIEVLLNCCAKLNKSLIVVTHDTSFSNLVDKKFQLKEGYLLDDR